MNAFLRLSVLLTHEWSPDIKDVLQGGAAQEKGHSRGPEHNGILSRFRSSHHVSPQADKVVLHHTVNLLTATIKLDAEQTDLRFCFRIISPSKNYSLQVLYPVGFL